MVSKQRGSGGMKNSLGGNGFGGYLHPLSSENPVKQEKHEKFYVSTHKVCINM